MLLFVIGSPGYALAADQDQSGDTPKVTEEGKGKNTAEHTDKRGDIIITAHSGLSVDSFAADSTKTYLNFNDANKNKSRATYGFDMEYRLLGSGENDIEEPNDVFFNGVWNPQLWIYGHTLHGMRSAEVDCNAHPTLSVCSGKILAPPNASNNLFLLRNATSLEAYLGLRYEFITLQAGGKSPANLYVSGELGFVTVADNGGDVIDMHKINLGAVLIGGAFKNSFLEVGYGKTDLFLRHKSRRFKVAAKAQWTPPLLKNMQIVKDLSLFAKIVADTDLGSGADSIQSYFGISYSIDGSEF
ncbi:hypothetical protein JYT23_00925 [Mariprofundus ferrooxydans]|nr:hypothetical protein [Mariprofundus ferrooxydans]